MVFLLSRIPTPAGARAAVDSGVRGVLTVVGVVGLGFSTARWVVKRLPGRPGRGQMSVPTQTIGTDPRRRHGSRASRSLVR
jgi:hypothetical protein